MVEYILICVHCQEPFLMNSEQLNCRILRHGVYKDTMEQIDPHASKEVCDELRKTDKIFGCGYPISIVGDEPDLSVYPCDYL